MYVDTIVDEHILTAQPTLYQQGFNPAKEAGEITINAPTFDQLSFAITVWKYKGGARKKIGRAVVLSTELADCCGEITRYDARLCLTSVLSTTRAMNWQESSILSTSSSPRSATH